jgi:hypothetical protein
MEVQNNLLLWKFKLVRKKLKRDFFLLPIRQSSFLKRKQGLKKKCLHLAKLLSNTRLIETSFKIVVTWNFLMVIAFVKIDLIV